MLVQPIELPTLIWAPGTQARLWYAQPPLSLTGPPFQPQHQPGRPTGLELLSAILREARGAPPASAQAPTFIMLPECSIRPDEIDAALALIRDSVTNTIVVFGASQIDEAQAHSLEPGADLWDGASAGHFTNVAIIGIGGSDQIYLQPKIVRSLIEQDTHWRGRVVRYFKGRHVQFIVVICSELIDRPEGATTVREVINEIHASGGNLNLAIWIQHNPKPRSDEFADSIAEFRVFRTTVLVVASASDRQTRVNNFGVSGAIIPHDALPKYSSILTRRFHYSEPIGSVRTASRIVLLRYDAHVYRVDTVLAESIQSQDHAERGAIFEESQPFLLRNGTLTFSNEHVHLEDLTERAMQLALSRAPAALHDAIRGARSRLVEQTTTEFMAFLDVGIVPQRRDGAPLHPAGVLHPGGDFLCKCWDHRMCIDKLCDEEATASPFAIILEALAGMEVAGIAVRVLYDRARRTNVHITVEGQQAHVGVVYPFFLNAEGTEQAIWGERSANLVDSPYIVLGSGGRLCRPALADINPSRAAGSGAVRPEIGARSTLRAIYFNEFWASYEKGTLSDIVQRLIDC